MIASIRGELQALGSNWVVVDVGGVGMRVEVAEGRLSSAHVGNEIFLHTHLVVREDSLTLYGFATPEEIEVFGLLIAVTGVGPKSALGALSVLTPADIARAVQADDDRPFRQISGVGPKTAKLIALSLAGKLIPQRYLNDPVNQTGGDETDQNLSGSADEMVAATVLEGLIGLGYSEAQAELAVQDARQAGVTAEHSSLLRAALALLQAPKIAAKRPAGGRR